MGSKTIEKRFNQAVQLEKNGHYPQAMEEYRSIINDNPAFRKAFINLGSLYSRMDRLEDSMECYHAALKLGRDYLTYYNLGSIHYRRNEFKKAVINLEKSRDLNPAFARSAVVLGLSFSRLENLAAAESNYRDALGLDPDNRVAMTALSIIYYNSDRYEESIRLLNRILTVDSENTRIRDLKSNILYKTGRIEEYTEEIKSLRKISDGYRYFDEFIATVPVGAYTDRYGTIDEKIEILQERSDTHKESLITLSLCHLFKGETDRAIECLFEAKKRHQGTNGKQH